MFGTGRMEEEGRWLGGGGDFLGQCHFFQEWDLPTIMYKGINYDDVDFKEIHHNKWKKRIKEVLIEQ